jgi:hypothetical protein
VEDAKEEVVGKGREAIAAGHRRRSPPSRRKGCDARRSEILDAIGNL